jgi:hypothetical protein
MTSNIPLLAMASTLYALLRMIASWLSGIKGIPLSVKSYGTVHCSWPIYISFFSAGTFVLVGYILFPHQVQKWPDGLALQYHQEAPAKPAKAYQGQHPCLW